MKKLILLNTLFYCCMIIYAQSGKLDSSFGGKGWVTTGFPKINYYFENALQVLPQNDSSFIVLIDAGEGAGLLGHFNSDGTLDKKFGTEGYSAPIRIDMPVNIHQQWDGKIIMAGSKKNFNTGRADFVLARYNTDGTLDNTFKDNGKLTNNRFANIRVCEVLIQPDGKIVVAGNTDMLPDGDTIVVARYNSDGTPDNSFNEDGKLIYNSFSEIENVSSVAIQSDGKIIVSGTIFVPFICPGCPPDEGETELVLARFKNDGSLDSSFGGDGRIEPGVGSPDDNFYCILQNDGKIVVAGTAGNPAGYDVTLGRYNNDGSPDLSFDGDGITVTDFGYNDYVSSVVLQNDGKILVTAWTGGNVISNSKNFALARYNNDGSPDTGFDLDGKVITNFRFNDFANSVAVESNGKIVVAGGSFDTSTNTLDYALAMYNADGSLDNNFSDDGKIIGYIPVGKGNLNSIAVQTDGKIVVAGTTRDNLRRYNFFISRHNSDGTPDTTFSRDGRQFRNFGFRDAVSGSLAIQNDGKIVVAGSVFAGTNPNTNVDTSSFVIARYNTDGSIDSTFNNDGKQITDFGRKYIYNIASCVAIQNDGKILVAGTSGDTTFHFDMALARYNTDGKLDSTFSENGRQTAGFGSGESRAYSIAVDSSKKIVVVGSNNANSGIMNFAIARFNSNGSPDNTFSDDGKQTTNFGSNFSSASSVAIQGDGKIVAAGRAIINNSDFAIARYSSDGSVDSTFNEDGKLTTGFGLNESASSVTLQTDGKIVVVGAAINTSFTGDIALARYNSDGSPDSSFDTEGRLTTDFGGDEGGSAAAIFKDKLYVARNNIIAAYNLTNKNKPPTVTLTIPYNIVKYTGPARIKLNAAVANISGTIKKVQFYNGTTRIHTEVVSPYGFLWVNVPVGNYAFTVKAIDDHGNVTISNSIEVSIVDENVPPVVSIVNPVNDTTYTGPATIQLIAKAKDPNDRISKVEFYNESTLLITDHYYPYTYTWNKVQPGTYTLAAKVTDDKGLSATSATVTVTVTAPNIPFVSSKLSSVNSKTDPNSISLKLSPNPASNSLQIFTGGLQQNKKLTISAVSVSGVVIKTIKTTSNRIMQMDVSSLRPGVYFLKVISGDKVMYTQFVKL